ncbi:uncharacterized protein BJ171DRAFT_256976 [Polychytrium aggregatum]|uniref:uncharacterized protein n=1 Tax=Polychytrium aggregatum TaxID=110093 RepID=UPI0022FEF901|nr:uncharacterized protein BJ171DRAFT_256976 [Polychytrium aggregatum]KAI9207895.1 hypothetical protein BJ171DRAFT_256976 [Polychytrium aggregatum]
MSSGQIPTSSPKRASSASLRTIGTASSFTSRFQSDIFLVQSPTPSQGSLESDELGSSTSPRAGAFWRRSIASTIIPELYMYEEGGEVDIDEPIIEVDEPESPYVSESTDPPSALSPASVTHPQPPAPASRLDPGHPHPAHRIIADFQSMRSSPPVSPSVEQAPVRLGHPVRDVGPSGLHTLTVPSGPELEDEFSVMEAYGYVSSPLPPSTLSPNSPLGSAHDLQPPATAAPPTKTLKSHSAPPPSQTSSVVPSHPPVPHSASADIPAAPHSSPSIKPFVVSSSPSRHSFTYMAATSSGPMYGSVDDSRSSSAPSSRVTTLRIAPHSTFAPSKSSILSKLGDQDDEAARSAARDPHGMGSLKSPKDPSRSPFARPLAYGTGAPAGSTGPASSGHRRDDSFGHPVLTEPTINSIIDSTRNSSPAPSEATMISFSKHRGPPFHAGEINYSLVNDNDPYGENDDDDDMDREDEDDDEDGPASGRSTQGPNSRLTGGPVSEYVFSWNESTVKRNVLYSLSCPLVVLSWVVIPVPQALVFDSTLKSPAFLFFYIFGAFNFVLLTYLQSVYQIYQLDWRRKYLYLPRLGQSGIVWFLPLLGVYILHLTTHLDDGVCGAMAVFGTVMGPCLGGWLKTRYRKAPQSSGLLSHQNSVQSSTSDLAGSHSSEFHVNRFHSPTPGYDNRKLILARRYQWFLALILLSVIGSIVTKLTIDQFIHGADGKEHGIVIVSVYTTGMLIFVSLLDYLATWISDDQIKCWPLNFVSRMFFYMLYFVFYRTILLFLTIEEIAVVQLTSVVWIVFVYPILMTSQAHAFLIEYVGLNRSYHDHIRHVTRSFFLRTIAESTTVIFSLLFSLTLYIFPSKVYPIYNFGPDDHGRQTQQHPYSFPVTFAIIFAVNLIELLVANTARQTFQKSFRLLVARETVSEFAKYPGLFTICWITVVVGLMGMVICALDYQSFA